jgi:hypothetical protein
MELGIVTPIYYRLVKKEGDDWKFYPKKIFYRSSDSEYINPEDLEAHYGLTLVKVAIELFRINAGRDGYYLANLRDRKYYYCGLIIDDVKATLHSLGIGRLDPVKY